jgi:hypothetical protein
MAAAAEGEGKSNDFAVNAAVVREYLTALVQTGRLAQFGDNPNAAPAEGQSHRSLPQLLADLQQVARGQQLAGAPGATLAQPLHVIVQPLVRWVALGRSPPLSMSACCCMCVNVCSRFRKPGWHVLLHMVRLAPTSAACPAPRPPAGEGGGGRLLD